MNKAVQQIRCLGPDMTSDGAEVTCGGRLFQKVAPETGKARLPTVERLNGWLVEVDCKTLHFLLEKSQKKSPGRLHPSHVSPLVVSGHLTPWLFSFNWHSEEYKILLDGK